MSEIRFDTALNYKAPGALRDAIARAARRLCVSQSAYVRSAVVERIRADGLTVEFDDHPQPAGG
jgi:hypothetical protein